MAPVTDDFADEYLEGFPDCAAFIATSDDVALFRWYKTLSVRNLLHMQLELATLEGQLLELDELDKKDITDADTKMNREQMLENLLTAKSWEWFAQKAKTPGSRAEHKMRLIRTIRETLKEYRK